MTPDERQLIVEFFDRLAAQGPAQKDRAADALIGQEMRRNPDAAYLLVQTALVYEQQFADMQAQIADLEAQLARDETNAQEEGSFLGGKLGQRRPAAMQSARAGGGAGYARVDPNVFDDGEDDAHAGRGRVDRDVSPWGGSAPARSSGFGGSARQDAVRDAAPDLAPSARFPSAPASMPTAASPPRPAAGGGFLRAAMATAAGVAGGLMLGETLKGLLGGDGSAHAGESGGADQLHTDVADPGKLDAASDEAFFQDFPDDGADGDGGIEI